MKITVITLARDEEKMIPFFLRHYQEFADEILVYDHHSTDRTRELVEQCPKARWQLYSTGGVLRDDIHAEMKSLSYQNKGPFPPDPPVSGNWFIVVDCDEFVWHPNIRDYLNECAKASITLPLVDGYEMVGDDGIPAEDGKTKLTDVIKLGVPWINQCKRAAIYASCDVRFHPGAHTCEPRGIVKATNSADIKLFHYKWLSLEYVTNKMLWARSNMSPENRANFWGNHVHDLSWVEPLYNQWRTERKQVVP